MTTPATTPPIVARCDSCGYQFTYLRQEMPCSRCMGGTIRFWTPLPNLTTAHAEIARLRDGLEHLSKRFHAEICDLTDGSWAGSDFSEYRDAQLILKRTDNPAEASVSGIVVKEIE